jgi:hypothetical protein
VVAECPVPPFKMEDLKSASKEVKIAKKFNGSKVL